MKASRTYVTIQDPKQVVLADVPFQLGERVEVVLLAEESNRTAISRELQDLFRTTQTLPLIQALSEADLSRAGDSDHYNHFYSNAGWALLSGTDSSNRQHRCLC